MSCDWDVWCETCKSNLGLFDNNRGDDYVRVLIRIAGVLANMGDAAKVFTDHTGQGVKAGYYDREKFDPVWFADHRGHDLRCKNEYGQLDTQCTQRVLCNFGEYHNCQLNLGHDGECKPKPTQS